MDATALDACHAGEEQRSYILRSRRLLGGVDITKFDALGERAHVSSVLRVRRSGPHTRPVPPRKHVAALEALGFSEIVLAATAAERG